jgi:hypothetical protein
LHTVEVDLPTAKRTGRETVTARELGIGYPVLINPQTTKTVYVEDPTAPPADPDSGQPANTSRALECFEFVVQFSWKQTPPSKRLEIREAQQEAADNMTAGVP